jgi:hypothetical protein
VRKEYLAFVTSRDELTKDKDNVLIIRDLMPGRRKYNAKLVRAEVSPVVNEIPGWDILWIRYWNGFLYPEPMGIKVLEEDPEALMHGRPHEEMLKLSK